jgi:acylphosphatase
MTVVRVHLYISGRVQGVYYRRNAMQEALRLGLTGWVRNLPDRRVEAVAEGEEERVEEFVRWCRKGPPLAIVREVKIHREPATGWFDAFEIRH